MPRPTTKPKVTFAAMTVGLALAAAAAGFGCESDADRAARGEGFTPEGAVRSPQRFVDVQQAAGARGEGNLYEAHFVGGDLNSLGRAKLDAMLSDDDRLPVVVHLAPVADAGLREDRMRAVSLYLRDGGLRDSQIRFTDGLNEQAYAPAAAGIKSLAKTDAGTQGPADAAEPMAPLLPGQDQ